jgi:hypothetical protein
MRVSEHHYGACSATTRAENVLNLESLRREQLVLRATCNGGPGRPAAPEVSAMLASTAWKSASIFLLSFCLLLSVSRDLGGVCRALQRAQKHSVVHLVTFHSFIHLVTSLVFLFALLSNGLGRR